MFLSLELPAIALLLQIMLDGPFLFFLNGNARWSFTVDFEKKIPSIFIIFQLIFQTLDLGEEAC